MDLFFKTVNGAGVLDYVTCWYVRAANYLKHFNYNHEIKCAFVSTNSISQGEQVGILWNELYNKYHIKIHFSHRTFKWGNEAKGAAAVHVVIIGFSNVNISEKSIFEYSDIKGEPHEIKVRNINPYLVEGNDTFIVNRKRPICQVSEINYGSMPIDNGHLILTNEEKIEFIIEEPINESLIKQYTGGEEFINSKLRWCIWLPGINPEIINQSNNIRKRIEKTKEFRLSSNREATKRSAEFPGLFGEIRQPSTDYIIIPKVSSENRKYIPIGILNSNIISSGSVLVIPNASLYNFGILTSIMHMVWTGYVCGRLESRFQYSASIVYNNYPWPENPSEKQIKAVEDAAQKVLDTRALFPKSSLAVLYDPLTMPPALVKAHQALDKAVHLVTVPSPSPPKPKG